MTTAPKTADALADHWTDRLPERWRPYARLARLDRPVGWQLLALPCLMGVALARTGEAFTLGDLVLSALFVIGAIAMRGAGCVWNDILDRDVDAKVARTALRPIPAGQVSVRQALGFMAALLGVGLFVLLLIPVPAKIVALLSIPLVALYPLMKRITWWPQAWLGLAFSWGALVAGAAVDGLVLWPILLLFAGCVAWTIAYDTIYALQDIEDDAVVGVRSTARLFGARWRMWTLGFYAAAFILWILAAIAGGAGALAPIALLGLGSFIVRPLVTGIDADAPASALAAFKRNVPLGLMLAGAFAIDPVSVTMGFDP